MDLVVYFMGMITSDATRHCTGTEPNFRLDRKILKRNYEHVFYKLYMVSCLNQKIMHLFSNVRQIKGLHALNMISEKQTIKQEEVVSLLKLVMVFDDAHQI